MTTTFIPHLLVFSDGSSNIEVHRLVPLDNQHTILSTYYISKLLEHVKHAPVFDSPTYFHGPTLAMSSVMPNSFGKTEHDTFALSHMDPAEYQQYLNGYNDSPVIEPEPFDPKDCTTAIEEDDPLKDYYSKRASCTSKNKRGGYSMYGSALPSRRMAKRPHQPVVKRGPRISTTSVRFSINTYAISENPHMIALAEHCVKRLILMQREDWLRPYVRQTGEDSELAVLVISVPRCENGNRLHYQASWVRLVRNALHTISIIKGLNNMLRTFEENALSSMFVSHPSHSFVFILKAVRRLAACLSKSTVAKDRFVKRSKFKVSEKDHLIPEE